jgi:hypothetical protein
MWKTRKSLMLSIVLALGLAWLYFINPFNWFVERSSRYSDEAFFKIRAGMTVPELTRLLGKPIFVMSTGDKDWRCSSCSAMCFVGNAPKWVKRYRESWVFVRDNRVITPFMYNFRQSGGQWYGDSSPQPPWYSR